jgi:hypothetical protein
MATDDLTRLARRVRASCIDPFFSDDDYLEKAPALPPELRDQLVPLMGGLREAIPNDFAFSLACEVGGMRVLLEFQDGDTASMAGEAFFVSRKSMLRKMRTANWDERRAECIQQSEVFDEMVDKAEDRPANMPSSEEAAKRHGDDLEAAIEGVRAESPIPGFALIVGNEEAGVSVSDYQIIPAAAT